jgi:hypothetical protein
MNDPFYYVCPIAFLIGSIGVLLGGIAVLIEAIKG